jgi:hypothetical protein
MAHEHLTSQQIEALLAAEPERLDDPECPYDPNDSAAVDAYWADARPTLPGQHRFQQQSALMTEKTVVEKMYVKNATAIVVLNADARHAALLTQLPPALLDKDAEVADFVLVFVNSQSELEVLLPQAKERLAAKGALWVAYVKGTSKHKSDVHRDTVRDHAATLGLDSVAMISIDDDWSALRLKHLS